MADDSANLLLVDDERDFLESLARRLSLRNFTVHTAESGQAALELLDREPIDVAVLDVRMPGMDGVATLKELKRRYPGVEVLMLTGHADLDGPLRGLQSGFYDYLTKPVDIERLIAKIQSALERARGHASAPGRTFSQKMKERMATADRLAVLGTMAASVVHELNNPLAVINDSTGYMQTVVAKADLPAETREKLEMALGKSAAALDRARNISRRLLSFARGAESQTKLVDLSDMVSEVIEFTRKPAQHMNVEVTAQTEAGPLTVRLDPHKLRQVLLNLVVNAIQAQESGGKVEIVISGNENEAVISVRDFGPGIPPENMERIFEPFFTTKPEGIGTGLGLPVTRGIVEELRGRLVVESKEGEGAAFKVMLPREQTPVSGDAAREKAV